MSVASIEQQVRKLSLFNYFWSGRMLIRSISYVLILQVGALMVQFPPLNPPPQASASALADQVTCFSACTMDIEKFILSNIFILFRTPTTARSAWRRCLSTTQRGSTPVGTDSTTTASMSELFIGVLSYSLIPTSPSSPIFQSSNLVNPSLSDYVYLYWLRDTYPRTD